MNEEEWLKKQLRLWNNSLEVTQKKHDRFGDFGHSLKMISIIIYNLEHRLKTIKKTDCTGRIEGHNFEYKRTIKGRDIYACTKCNYKKQKNKKYSINWKWFK